MNKKVFKENLLKGHGTCYLLVKENPERYKEIILWACTHKIYWDHLDSSAHANYLYQIISCYENKDVFFQAIRTAYLKLSNNKKDLFKYLSSLLFCFWKDGNHDAHELLIEKYESLYNYLMLRQRASLFFSEKECFNILSLILANDDKLYFEVMEKTGRLLVDKKIYDVFDFNIFFDRYNSNLLTFKNSRDNIYLKKMYIEFKNNAEELVTLQKHIKLAQRTFKKDKNSILKDEIEKYLGETDDNEKAKLLSKLFASNFKNNPSSLLRDAESSNEELRKEAINLLQNVRHIDVEKWVFNHINNDNYYDLLPILITNYRKKYEKLIMKYLNALKISFNGNDDWFSSIMSVAISKARFTKEILLFAYNHNYSDYSRYLLFLKLYKKGFLNQEMIQNGLYDSSNNIRDLSNKVLKNK